jgi:hypothetical protein
VGTIKNLQRQAAGLPPDADGNPLDDPSNTALKSPIG